VRHSIVLLHGFAGTRRAWDAVAASLDSERYLPLALDLPGHGDAAGADGPITFAGCVAAVLAAAPERFTLGGYSMGARVALHVALAAPERVERLVLIAATPGIEDADERDSRRRGDRALADDLENVPFEDFIERWRTQPLFADEPPVVAATARADHRRNRPPALAAALRGIGTGEMEPLWDRLGDLTMPVSLLAGDRDAKYLAIARRMAPLLPDGELVVLPGGHALALESPAAVAAALERRGG
jgi:2-succinyl-6-hydroxy-2,4-cyclohexadiene-1-carboxylate synthase